MKITSIIYSALLAVAAAEAAPAPNAAAEANRFCQRRGEVCSKLKRAADAAAEALALPEPSADALPAHHFCYRPGEVCSKAKRDALALAEAVAEAHASANPGKSLSLVSEPYRSSSNNSIDADPGHFCNRRGEVCSKAKRDALASAEAAAEAYAIANPVPLAEASKALLSPYSLNIRKLC